MLPITRKCALAAGAAALLSAQPAYAAPVATAPAVDPLVALSMLGTSQSRTAVCGSAPVCALPMVRTSAPSASPPFAAAASAAAVQGGPKRRESTGILTILAIGGAMIIIAVLAATLVGDEDDPVSPD